MSRCRRLTVELASRDGHGIERLARVTAVEPTPDLEQELLRLGDRWARLTVTTTRPRTLAEAWATPRLPRAEKRGPLQPAAGSGQVWTPETSAAPALPSGTAEEPKHP